MSFLFLDIGQNSLHLILLRSTCSTTCPCLPDLNQILPICSCVWQRKHALFIYHQWECRYFLLYPAFHETNQQTASATVFSPLKFSPVSLTLIQHVTTLLETQSHMLSYLCETPLTKIRSEDKHLTLIPLGKWNWQHRFCHKNTNFNFQLTSWLFQSL